MSILSPLYLGPSKFYFVFWLPLCILLSRRTFPGTSLAPPLHSPSKGISPSCLSPPPTPNPGERAGCSPGRRGRLSCLLENSGPFGRGHGSPPGCLGSCSFQTLSGLASLSPFSFINTEVATYANIFPHLKDDSG